MIDTHRHINGEAEGNYGSTLDPTQMRSYPVDWRGIRTKEDVLNQIRGLLEKYKFQPGEWIHFRNRLQFGTAGTGADHAKIIYDELNRWELDKVTPDNPVILSMGVPEYNGLFVNSKAVDMIWDKYGDFIRKNGRYWVNSAGQPDGHFESPATRIIQMIYEPRPAAEVLAPLYKKELEELASMGLTTVSSRFPAHSVATWKLLESRGELTARMAYGNEDVFGTVTDLTNGTKVFKGQVGTGSDKVWMNSIAPSSVDGSSSRSCMSMKRVAAYGTISDWWPMGQCYYDIEFRGAEGKGSPIQQNYFRDWAFASARDGMRFANTHVAGERSVALLLSIIDQIQQQMGASSTKDWALDHCTFVNPADLPKAARLGVSFSCAPKYLMDGTAAAAAKAYGEKIANTYMVPIKSMVTAGIQPVFETDRDIYAWVDLEAAMTRKDKDGKVWGPQERVDRVTTLKMATSWAADYVLKGDQLGSLEAGKLADLLVLDKDYMTVPEEEVGEIQPQVTVFDGRVIFVHPRFAQEYNLRPAGAVVATYQELVARRTRSAGGGPGD